MKEKKKVHIKRTHFFFFFLVTELISVYVCGLHIRKGELCSMCNMYIIEKSVSQSIVLKFEIFNYEVIFYHRKNYQTTISDVELYRLKRKSHCICINP